MLIVQAECWKFVNIEIEIGIGTGNITSSLQRVVTLCGWQHPSSYMTFWSGGQVTNVKSYIYLSAIPMATKIGGVVTYGGGSPPSKSHDLLITWSRDK